MIEDVTGALIAIVAAMGVVYIDGYQAIRTKLFRAPMAFWRSRAFLAFSTGCGLIAATAYLLSIHVAQQSAWLGTILGTNIDNSYLRALYTGLAVITIIRSKLLQIRNADFGLEYFYSEIRIKCLGLILMSWVEQRDSIIRDNLDGLFDQPDFENEVIALINATIAYADTDYRTSVTSQLAGFQDNKPKTVANRADPAWRASYRTLLNIALENCGPEVLRRKGLTRR